MVVLQGSDAANGAPMVASSALLFVLAVHYFQKPLDTQRSRPAPWPGHMTLGRTLGLPLVRAQLRRRRQTDETSELPSVRAPFKVIDDPDADRRIVETSPSERQCQVLGQTIAVDGDHSQSLHVNTSRCLPDPVVEDLRGHHKDRFDYVGMDVNVVVMKGFIGAPADLRTQMAMVGGVGLADE